MTQKTRYEIHMERLTKTLWRALGESYDAQGRAYLDAIICWRGRRDAIAELRRAHPEFQTARVFG